MAELTIMNPQTKVTGVILAGGRGSRMGNQDKGLVIFNGKPLVSYAITAMQGVTDNIIISANRNIAEYERFGFPVISDQTSNFDGPLAGILTAMNYAKTGVILVMPCDSPFITSYHLKQLLETHENENKDVAVAIDGEHSHSALFTANVSLQGNLENFMASGQHKLADWLAQLDCCKVNFSREVEIFRNINTLSELVRLETKASN